MVNRRSLSKSLLPRSDLPGPDLLRVENLTKAFSGVEVLKNLTLGIRPGEITGCDRRKRRRQVHLYEADQRRLFAYQRPHPL